MDQSAILAVVTAAGTIALVAVTIYYAIQTRRTVAEMTEARQLTPWPLLTCDLVANAAQNRTEEGLYYHYLRLENVGNAPALNISWQIASLNPQRATLKVTPTSGTLGVLADGMDHPISLDRANLVLTGAEAPRFAITMRYANVYGRRFSTSTTTHLAGTNAETFHWAKDEQRFALDR